MKNLNLFHKISLVAAFATAISATGAQAQTLVTANLANPDPTIINTGSGEPRTYNVGPGADGDLGFLFQVGSDNLLVTGLGLYAPSSGLAADTGVYIYKLPMNGVGDGGTLVTSATVDAGTKPNSSGFAYESVPLNLTTPAALLAGDYYVIDYTNTTSDAFYDAKFSNGSSAAQLAELFDTSAITPLGVSLSNGGATSPFPQGNNGYPFYIGPNAQFINVGKALIPEPSSFALLIAGGFAAVAFFRLRQKA